MDHGQRFAAFAESNAIDMRTAALERSKEMIGQFVDLVIMDADSGDADKSSPFASLLTESEMETLREGAKLAVAITHVMHHYQAKMRDPEAIKKMTDDAECAARFMGSMYAHAMYHRRKTS